MDAELTPCPLLEYFFQRTRPARKGNERVTQIRKFGLSLMHRFDHVKSTEAMMRYFAFH